MSPREYLDLLQKDNAAEIRGGADELVFDLGGPRLADALGIPFDRSLHENLKSRIRGRSIVDLFEEDILPLSQQILNSIAPNDKHRLVNTVVGVLPTLDPNASAIRVPDDCGYVVAIDGGLWPTLRALNELTAVALSPPKEGFDLEKIAREFYRRSGYFLNVIQRPTPDFFMCSWQAAMLCHALTKAQMMFVLGHEFGHVIEGHLPSKVAMYWTLPHARVEFIPKRHEHEFDADAIGYRLAIQAYRNIDPLLDADPWLMKFGVFLFFTYLEMFESLGFLPRLTPSHPPAGRRLEQLHSEIVRGSDPDRIQIMANVQRLCRRVRHPIVTVEQKKRGLFGFFRSRVCDAFYASGEIVANAHTVGLLPLLFPQTHVYDLQTDSPPPSEWARLESHWRTKAREMAQQSALYADQIAKKLREFGSSFTVREVMEANADSLFNYNKQWWPFYAYVRPLVGGAIPAFVRISFEDDPSEIGNLPPSETIIPQTKQDLIYTWQLNRNHGILKILRLAVKQAQGILIFDTPMKLIARWAHSPGSSVPRYPIGVVFVTLGLPCIPTLTPDELVTLRKVVFRDTQRFAEAIADVTSCLRLMTTSNQQQSIVEKLRVLSAEFELKVREPLRRIEAEVIRRMPERVRVPCTGTFVLGPVASSPTLPSPQDKEIVDVNQELTLDPTWLQYVVRTNAISLCLKFPGQTEWPASKSVESPYWNMYNQVSNESG